MTIHDVFAKVSPRFRRRRMADFMARFRPGKGTRILDVGGYPGFWAEANTEAHITILNIHPFEVMEAMRDRCTPVIGDGTNLHFGDGEFDIVFSNSVIEHLRTWEAQQQFAQEVRRVGRHYWVQTPAREFFVEPHLLTPCIHWLPRAVQLKLARRWTFWGIIERPTQPRAEEYVSELRLLKFDEVSELFPESLILRERFFGFTKSYVAIAPPNSGCTELRPRVVVPDRTPLARGR